MGVTVSANQVAVAHKSSNEGMTLAFPDVCKTPAPGGPVPIPYPSIATTPGARTGIASKSKVATKSSKMTSSRGDEAGTHKGIKSAAMMQKMKYRAATSRVYFEGASVSRMSSPTLNAPPPIRCANPACLFHSAGIPASQTAMLPAQVKVEFSPRVVCLECYRKLAGLEPRPAATTPAATD